MTKSLSYPLALILLCLTLAFACKNREKTVVEEQVVQVVEVEEAMGDSAMVGEVKEEPVEPVEVIYYERTSFFGTCPSFTFSAMSNGECTYKGRNFVDRIGTYTGVINPDRFQDIYTLAESLGYDTLKAKYDEPMVTDLPAVITGIQGKKVTNRYRGPNLKPLYTALDSLVEDVIWKQTKGQN